MTYVDALHLTVDTVWASMRTGRPVRGVPVLFRGLDASALAKRVESAICSAKIDLLPRLNRIGSQIVDIRAEGMRESYS